MSNSEICLFNFCGFVVALAKSLLWSVLCTRKENNIQFAEDYNLSTFWLQKDPGDSEATTTCLSSQSESRTGLHLLHICTFCLVSLHSRFRLKKARASRNGALCTLSQHEPFDPAWTEGGVLAMELIIFYLHVVATIPAVNLIRLQLVEQTHK